MFRNGDVVGVGDDDGVDDDPFVVVVEEGELTEVQSARSALLN